MDDAKNFLLGLMQTARERFGNPLISAFAISWIIWNFRLVLIFFGNGDGGWQGKITYIDTKLMPHWRDWLIHGIAIPLASSLFWIYVLPPLLRRIASDHEKNQNLNREAIFTITEARTLSSEEAFRLREVMIKQRAEWQAEKAETLQSLENYSNKQEITLKELDEAKKTIDIQTKEIEELKKQIEKLNAPPPRKQFDFHQKTTEEKARALGLKIKYKNSENPDLVTFDNKSISWPWHPSEYQKFDIQYNHYIKYPIDEMTIAGVIFLINNKHAPIKQPTSSWAHFFMIAGFQNSEELVEKLLIHGFLSGTTSNPDISQNCMSFGIWLKSIGFSSNITIQK